MFSAKQENGENTAKHSHLELGKEGEVAACKYLQTKGYTVLGKNVWEKFGEIDILARHPNGTLVFVEVKSISLNNQGYVPEDQMTGAKIKKLLRVCEFFANKHPELINDKRGWQIDSLCLTKEEKDFVIKHYENIV